jgi:hypothetical protein
MSTDRYQYCALYVRGLPERPAIKLLTTLTDGHYDHRTIRCDAAGIDVLSNPDHAADSDDFVGWPIKVELHPHPATPPQQTVALTAKLLTELWNHGYDAIAACDYEQELPDEGGYPRYRR